MNFGRTRATVMTLASLSLCTSVLLSAALAGPPPKTPKPTPKPTAAEIAAGKKVYEANNCKACHAINGDGGPTGPDLSKEGADAKHTAAWLKIQVIKPKEHSPNGSMPAYEDKIKGKDLTNLVSYLGSLKGAVAKPK